MYVLVYVDDIIVTESSDGAVQSIITSLASKFPLKDLGNLSYFLGIEVLQSSDGLFLNQRKYIHDLLIKAGTQDIKPATTPIAALEPLLKDQGTPLPSPTDYRALVGSLQYLQSTRPDVAYATNKLSQFMQCPIDVHWVTLKRDLRYLAGTPLYGIHISKTVSLQFHAYSDVDHGGDWDTYHSTFGYILYLGSSPISWSSRKKCSIARSSTKAEYKAMADASAEIIWVQSLLVELHYTPAVRQTSTATTWAPSASVQTRSFTLE